MIIIINYNNDSDKMSLRIPGVSVLVTHVIHTDVFNVRREPFIEPQVRPPARRHQVTEPLMRQLVRHHRRHVLLVGGGGHTGVVQHRSLPGRNVKSIRNFIKKVC